MNKKNIFKAEYKENIKKSIELKIYIFLYINF
jgi:hypothetical protein